ncbi:MAG: hypothetical protein Q8P67_09575, partial [archaeon]|nr:hypothetical protein [archaeon]
GFPLTAWPNGPAEKEAVSEVAFEVRADGPPVVADASLARLASLPMHNQLTSYARYFRKNSTISPETHYSLDSPVPVTASAAWRSAEPQSSPEGGYGLGDRRGHHAEREMRMSHDTHRSQPFSALPTSRFYLQPSAQPSGYSFGHNKPSAPYDHRSMQAPMGYHYGPVPRDLQESPKAPSKRDPKEPKKTKSKKQGKSKKTKSKEGKSKKTKDKRANKDKSKSKSSSSSSKHKSKDKRSSKEQRSKPKDKQSPGTQPTRPIFSPDEVKEILENIRSRPEWPSLEDQGSDMPPALAPIPSSLLNTRKSPRIVRKPTAAPIRTPAKRGRLSANPQPVAVRDDTEDDGLDHSSPEPPRPPPSRVSLQNTTSPAPTAAPVGVRRSLRPRHNARLYTEFPSSSDDEITLPVSRRVRAPAKSPATSSTTPTTTTTTSSSSSTSSRSRAALRSPSESETDEDARDIPFIEPDDELLRELGVHIVELSTEQVDLAPKLVNKRLRRR